MDRFRGSLIIGNDALFKCSAPSFISDFVFKGNVMSGNDLILKCIFPSHVADMVAVIALVDSEGTSFANRGQYGNYSGK